MVTLGLSLDPGGQIEIFEQKTLDARFRFYAKPTPFTDSIVILDISEESIKAFEPVYGTWPWPRSLHGEVVEYLMKDGAKAVGFDLIFSEKTTRPDVSPVLMNELRTFALNADVREIRDILIEKLSRLRPEVSDNSFSERVREAGNVIQAAVFYVNNEEYARSPSLGASKKAQVKIIASLSRSKLGIAGSGRIPVFQNVTVPFDTLSEASAGIGHVNFIPDRDGPCRRFLPLVAFGMPDAVYPSFPIAIALQAKGLGPNDIRLSGNTLLVGDAAIPLLRDGSSLIDYQGGVVSGKRGAEGNYESFYHYIPYHYVIASKDLAAKGEEPVLSPGTFRDKIVLVGATAAGLKDVRSTPFSPTSPGIEIHANVIDNLLANKFLYLPPTGVVSFYFFLLALLISHVTSVRGPYGGLVASLVSALIVLSLHWYVFRYGMVLRLVSPTMAMGTSYLVTLVIKYAIEEKEKAFIKMAFGRYVAPAVMEEMLRSPEKLKLGGQKRFMSVLFSDIEGFTAMSEKSSPEDVGILLQEYFSAMVDCVKKTGGTLDKFIGDAIMAEWNAPAEQPEHAALACECSLLMMEELQRLRVVWKKDNKPLLNIRIGINTGEMIAGNMGSKEIFDYTVIGTEVNTASRLEPLNKDFGTHLAISEATKEAAERSRPGAFHARRLARVVLKGRSEPIWVYELTGRTKGLDRQRVEGIEKYEAGLDLFMSGEFQGALALFEDALDIIEDDGPSKVYRALCGSYLNDPPVSPWDGVYHQTTK